MAYVNREFLLNKIKERKEALVGSYGGVDEAPYARVKEWKLWDEMERYIYQADTIFTESDVNIKTIKPRNVKWDYTSWTGVCECGCRIYSDEIYCRVCGNKLDWIEEVEE